MVIIVGGEPDVHGAVGMLSEKVGSMHARKNCVCANLVQNSVCMCCALCRSVETGLCKVTSKKMDVRESQGWQHQQAQL